MTILSKLKKNLLALAISCLVLTSSAGVPYQFNENVTKTGIAIYQIQNNTNAEVYCWVESEYYFNDFYVYPRSVSRWYKMPDGMISWGCS